MYYPKATLILLSIFGNKKFYVSFIDILHVYILIHTFRQSREKTSTYAARLLHWGSKYNFSGPCYTQQSSGSGRWKEAVSCFSSRSTKSLKNKFSTVSFSQCTHSDAGLVLHLFVSSHQYSYTSPFSLSFISYSFTSSPFHHFKGLVWNRKIPIGKIAQYFSSLGYIK